MKKNLTLLFAVLLATNLWAVKSFLAPDSIYYYPFADGEASVLGCVSSEKNIVLPAFVQIPDSCLYDSAAEPAFMRTYKVATIGKSAFNSSKIESIVLPDSLRKISESAFQSCNQLKEIILPSTLEFVGKLAFFNCTNLTSIVLPDRVDYIGEQAFSRCSRAETIRLGDGIDSLRYNVFYSCSSLKTLSLGSGVVHIADGAFSRCAAFDLVKCYAPNPPVVEQKAFVGVELGNTELQVHCNVVSVYEQSSTWKTFSSINVLQDYRLTTDVSYDEAFNPQGEVQIVKAPSDCNDYFAELLAVPAEGYKFKSWSDGVDSANYSLVLQSDTNLTARFIPDYTDTAYFEVTLCESNSLYIFNVEGTEVEFIPHAGVQFFVLDKPNHLGGDSVWAIDVTTNPVFDTVVELAICEGEEIEIGGMLYREAGEYRCPLKTINGCDSIVELHLSVIAVRDTMLEAELCTGDTLVFGELKITEAGLYQQVYTSSLGCDSVVQIDVVEREPYRVNVSVESVDLDGLWSDSLAGVVYGSVQIEQTGECLSDVVLTAIPNEGCYFLRWQIGAEEITDTTKLSLHIDDDVDVIVVFRGVEETGLIVLTELEPNISEQYVRLYNMSGLLIFEGKGLELSKLQSGMYLVRTERGVAKICIKQK